MKWKADNHLYCTSSAGLLDNWLIVREVAKKKPNKNLCTMSALIWKLFWGKVGSKLCPFSKDIETWFYWTGDYFNHSHLFVMWQSEIVDFFLVYSDFDTCHCPYLQTECFLSLCLTKPEMWRWKKEARKSWSAVFNVADILQTTNWFCTQFTDSPIMHEF